MDGGVYDNQGIQSLLLADERNSDELGVFIVSDADRESDDLYPVPDVESGDGLTLLGCNLGNLTLGTLNLIAWLITLICALTIAAVGYQSWERFHEGRFVVFWDLFVYLVPLALAVLTYVALCYGRRVIGRRVLPSIPQVGGAAWNDIKRLTLAQVLDMVNLRLTSLMSMANWVFMKRIRSLVFYLVYGNERYENKRVSNLIYHLKIGKKFENLPDVPEPSADLQRVAEVAANMDTTLWLNERHQLPCLVACGQATLCYNLMKYAVRVHGDDPESYSREVRQCWDRLVDDWKALVGRPYKLLEERLPDAELPMPPRS